MLLWGQAGALHPSGDSIELLSPFFAASGFLFSFALSGNTRLALLTIFAIWLGQWSYAILKPTGPAGELVIYQKNKLAGNVQYDALVRDIIDSDADFVTLQELAPDSVLLAKLRSTYPHQHVCQFSDWSGIAVLSKHPIVGGTRRCSRFRSVAAVQTETMTGKVWVASVHLFWPWPYSQARNLERIEPMLAGLEGPVILGGDLNMHPHTRVSRRVATLVGGKELRPVFPTLFVKGIPLFVDHIIAPSGTVSRRPRLGSDHFGVLGKVGLE